MEIFNIGPLELIVVLLIMFFLLGPKGMILTAQKIGSWIRGFVRSPMWREIMGYSQEIRELPKKIMDESGLQEALDDVQQTTKQTANELNATVNEAVQAARVPEAEHVKIDTSTIKKPEPVTTPEKPKSEVELLAERVKAINAEKEQENQAAAGESEGVSTDAPVEESVAAETHPVETLAPRKPRGRPRKTAVSQEEVIVEPQMAVETTPANLSINADVSSSGEEIYASGADLPVSQVEIIGQVVPQTINENTESGPKPRKPRAKKTETKPAGEVPNTGAEAATVHAVEEAAVSEAAPPKRTRKAKKDEVTPEILEAPAVETALIEDSRPADGEPVKRKAGRPRKTMPEASANKPE